MTDLQSTLDTIADLQDLCGTCDTVLDPNGPSRLYCDDACQDAWLTSRVTPLTGYREPVDLPQHICNQHEESDPEVTPEWLHREQYEAILSMMLTGNHYVRLGHRQPDWDDIPALAPVNVGDLMIVRHGDRMWSQVVSEVSMPQWGGYTITGVIYDEIRGLSPLDHARLTLGDVSPLALWTAAPEVSCPELEPIEYDPELPSTALLIPGEPVAPVMPAVTIDAAMIQRMIDTFTPRSLIRAPRYLNPRRSR